MADDFYCDEVFSGKTPVTKILETDNVLAYYHTKPYWSTHIVVVPKQHIGSLLTITDNELLLEILDVIKRVSRKVNEDEGACRVLTNLGKYQDSKHLHFHVCAGDPLR
ncbi:HIT family hydrolase [archaeon]|nr:HIT family hydrolase [archaeon]